MTLKNIKIKKGPKKNARRAGMKSNAELLNEFPEPYKSKIWANVETQRVADKAQMIEDLESVPAINAPHEALMQTIDWQVTPEGRDYWTKVCNKFYLKWKKENGTIQKP